MTGKFAAVCLAGLLGSLFVGYCIYFDRKRRSDPNYKKKVLASEGKWPVYMYGTSTCYQNSPDYINTAYGHSLVGQTLVARQRSGVWLAR